jgi:hypothetical protein
MIEGSEHLGFALETRQTIGIRGVRRRQEFQRHVTLEARIAGTIDLAHSARAECGEDFVRPYAIAWVEGHVPAASDSDTDRLERECIARAKQTT